MFNQIFFEFKQIKIRLLRVLCFEWLHMRHKKSSLILIDSNPEPEIDDRYWEYIRKFFGNSSQSRMNWT